jgi:hypothetical protein
LYDVKFIFSRSIVSGAKLARAPVPGGGSGPKDEPGSDFAPETS